MNRHIVIKLTCFSVIAPRQLLLRCPNKLLPCNDALLYYRPSMDIYVVKLRNSRAITRVPRLEPEYFNRQSVRPRLNQRLLN
jgi:hypothetical protein